MGQTEINNTLRKVTYSSVDYFNYNYININIKRFSQ